ncbi:MAG: lytic murein transglycosylase [Bdellovibrionota bacterium]
MKFALISLLLFASACASAPTAPSPARAPSSPSMGPTEFAAQKLRAKGMSPEFLALVQKNYREDQRADVLELNFLGFLKSNKSTGLETIPGWELRRVQKFLKSHKQTFKEAEREFHVPKEVVASLLWVETRHGRDLGHFHVASALFSIAQADYPTLLDSLLDQAKQKAADYDQIMANRIQERARTKSDWAADELMALQEIHQKGWKNAEKLHGSFSGAFGMAQFMPSSYLTWAKSDHAKPNLFKADDSILSVANYLSSNGWQGQDRQSQEGALFHYNRDKAYVTHILKMSDCLKHVPALPAKRAKRSTASAPSC